MANSRVQSQVFQIEYDIWHPTIVTNNDVRNAYCKTVSWRCWLVTFVNCAQMVRYKPIVITEH